MNRIPTDPDSIRRLALIMAETGMTELELVDKDSRIRVVRGGAVAPVAVMAAPVAVTVAPAEAAPAPVADASHPGAITSPMVGVAYLQASPGAPAFVTVGQQITAGQVLLQVEAMKTFNDIKAPRAGTVRQIMVENSAPVEYGEVLMIVD